MKLAISAPDHTTVNRRAVGLALRKAVHKGPLHVLIDSTGLVVFGAGPWLEAKHDAKSRRTWVELHLAVEADGGMIVAQEFTDQHIDDPTQVGPLLDQVEEEIGIVTADGACDGTPIYQAIAQYGDNIEVVIPPRSTRVPSTGSSPQSQRDCHLDMITTQSRLAWQSAAGYGPIALVETPMRRYKTLIGPRLRARGFEAQRTEAAIGVQVLNQMLSTGHSNSVRCKRQTA